MLVRGRRKRNPRFASSDYPSVKELLGEGKELMEKDNVSKDIAERICVDRAVLEKFERWLRRHAEDNHQFRNEIYVYRMVFKKLQEIREEYRLPKHKELKSV